MNERIDPDTGEVTALAAPVEMAREVSAMTLFGSDRPKDAMARMTEVAEVLSGVIEQKKLYLAITDKKTGKVKKHVVIEGWTLLGSLLGVFPRTVECEPVYEAGEVKGYKASVEAVTRSGQVIGAATALCLKTEKRGPWSYADDYALASMAQTRAASKALRMPLGFVMQLSGYEGTPGEEVPEGGFPGPEPSTGAAVGAQGGSGAQGSARPAPEVKPKPPSPPAAKVDAKGRPMISDGGRYHECPSCHNEAVRVHPSTGDAFCWAKAHGCGAKWVKKVWDLVSVDGPSSTDPLPKPVPQFTGAPDEPPPPTDDDLPF